MSTAKNQAQELFLHVDEIEEFIGFNEEIGQQVKLLAVNAGIQAAKAGTFGGGFKQVANRLRDMIRKSDANMDHSRAILKNIRSENKNTYDKIDLGVSQLYSNFRNLESTWSVLEKSISSFASSTDQVSMIAVTAKKQQTGMSSVMNAMDKIEETASQLDNSSNMLQTSVVQISVSQETLRQALHTER